MSCDYKPHSCEPCADCPRLISALHRCGLLQETMSDHDDKEAFWKKREAGVMGPTHITTGDRHGSRVLRHPTEIEREKRECAYYLNVVWPEICGGPEETTEDRLKDDVMDIWEERPEAMFKKPHGHAIVMDTVDEVSNP